MKQWMIVVVVVFGIAGGAFAAPTTASAQTLYETLNLAQDAENAAKKAYGLANQFEKMLKETSENAFLMGYAPTENKLFRHRTKAVAKAVRYQARAHELLAARLRHEAARRRRN